MLEEMNNIQLKKIKKKLIINHTKLHSKYPYSPLKTDPIISGVQKL